MTQHYENSLVSAIGIGLCLIFKKGGGASFFIVVCSLFLGSNYLFFLLVLSAYLFFSLRILTLPHPDPHSPVQPEDLTVHVGDIVAAPLPTNGSWYRARVLGTLENGNLDLYFVDFGDNGDCPLKDLRALRSVWRPWWSPSC